MAAVKPRGAHALNPKAAEAAFKVKYPAKPKPPRITAAPKVKPIDPNVQANNNAMSSFRAALAQLQQVVPQVDQNAIRAPYQAASVATGQLGTGLQASLAQSGQTAQDQYTRGLGQAQEQAARFGISAGAGANPTALQNNGTQLIAQQTQAQTAAAPMAATAWQQLLERTAAAKVSDAVANRDNVLTTAKAQLAGNLPAAVNAEKQLGFQEKTAKENMGLARSQLTAKQQNDLRDYLLGVGKLNADVGQANTKNELEAAKLKQKTGNDAAKLRVSQDTLALKKRTAKASAAGLKGVAAAAKALAGTTNKAGTKKVAKGWDVQVVSYDPEADATGTKSQWMQVPDKRHAPAGFKIVPGSSAKTHWETVPTSAGSAGITRATWDMQMRAMMAQNKDRPGALAEIKAFLGPRPKK